MMDKLSYLWETWLDKLTCVGIVAIVVSIVTMLALHQPEATASKVVSPGGALVPHSIQQRLPEIQTALDKSKKLLESKEYDQVVEIAQGIIQKDPKESFAYVDLARALKEKGDWPRSLREYAMAIKLNPDFVDKNSSDRIGPELKALVRNAVIESRKPEFEKIPESGKSLKALYYLQRRLAGGCE